MIRLEGCDGGGETTVLAHYRASGISGLGVKSPSILGAWSCYNCHMVCDGQIKSDLSYDDRELALLRGIARTINQLVKEGAVRGE
jgi:hypothetical protein